MAKKRKASAGRRRTETSPAWTTWWERQSERAQHLMAAGVLVAVSFGFFAPIHFSSRHLISGDTVQWISMAESMISYQNTTGEPALWATNTSAGMPGFMIYYPDVVPQLDVVPSLLRSVIWPSSHFLVLLFGMYLLTWFLTRNKPSAVFAAVAFGLTTYIPVILSAGHNTKFVALAWAPWLLLAFVYALRRPSLKSGLLFALALALNLRADHVQITYYVLFVILIWWIAEGVHAHRSGESAVFWKSTGWLAAGSVLGLVMIAQPYLAQLEYKRYTIRGAASGGGPGGMSWEYAMAWSQGPGELLTLLVANAFGGGTQYYWGPKSFTGGPHYLGALTVVLAAVLFVRKRDTLTWALGISALLMVLFSLGEHFPLVNRPMFRYFPLFDAFRVPETWLSVVALVMAVMAGRGLAGLLQDRERDAWKKPAYLAFGLLTAVLFLMMLAPDAALDFERSGERAQLLQLVQAQNPGISDTDPRVEQAISEEINRRKIERRAMFSEDDQRSVVFLVLGVLVLFLYFRRRIPGWLAGWAFVVLIVLDLGGVGRRYIRGDILTTADTPAEEVTKTAFDNFILDRIQEAGGNGHLRVASFENGSSPAVNARPSYFYESLGGYHAAKLRVYQDFLDHLLLDPVEGTLNSKSLDLLNVRYVVGRRAVPGYEAVFQDDATGNTVFENPDVLPRAFFVSEADIVLSPEETWARMQSESFDPGNTVLLAHETDRRSTPIDSSSVARAALKTYSPREIEFEVETDADRWLVVSEIYYPAGWTAEIDGSVVPIEQADYLLRAVHVEAGRHTVRMTFNPWTHVWGVRLSIVSSLLVYGGLAFLLLPGLLRRKKERAG